MADLVGERAQQPDREATPTGPDLGIGRSTEAGPARRRPGLGLLQHLAFFAFVMLTWEMVVRVGWIRAFILPPPTRIAGNLGSAVGNIVTGGWMLQHFVTTLTEVLVGFGLALAFGLVLAVVISEVPVVRRLTMPYIVALNATPRIAVAPLVLIWFGFGISSKIVLAAATAIFPILIGAIAGLNSADRDTIRLMRALGASRFEVMYRVRARFMLPYLFAGIETGIVLAVIGAIVGEFLGGNAGLGYLIVVAQETLDVPQVFALIILLAVFGSTLHRIAGAVRTRVVFWQGDTGLKP